MKRIYTNQQVRELLKDDKIFSIQEPRLLIQKLKRHIK
jgi:hypothetical protein